VNEWMNVGENPNRLSSVQEMADTSAREPRGLALALALVRCANSDLVGTKGLLHHPRIRGKAAAAARERAYEGRACDVLFRPS
jgi:hypothetical protein